MTANATARTKARSQKNALGTGANNDFSNLFQSTLPNNCKMTVKYCDISNVGTTVYNFLNQTGVVLDEGNNTYTDCVRVVSYGTNGNQAISINNSRMEKITGTMSGLSSTSSGSLTFNYCSFNILNPNDTTAGSTTTIEWNYCYFKYGINWGSYLDEIGYTWNDCLFEDVAGVTGVTYHYNKTYAMNRCIFSGNRDNVFFGADSSFSTGTLAATNCDLIRTGVAIYAVNQAATSANIILVSNYIAGCRGADINNYYTGSQTPAQTNGNTYITFTTPRTTPNFPMTPTSIAESGLGTNSVTIGWSTGFRTRNMIEYGTTSGTYTMTIQNDEESWSGWNGSQMTKTPSLTLSNLKSGTTYYYRVGSYNWATDCWCWSSEGDFTTTAEATGGRNDYAFIG